jgi:GNAT superfamily N-acetyltransferase
MSASPSLSPSPSPAPQLTIRFAVPEDGPALQALQARSPEGEELVLDMVNEPDFFGRVRSFEEPRVWVACSGDRIVGSAAAAIRTMRVGGVMRKVAYTLQIFVDPDARRLGVASGLIRERERYLREVGVVLVYGLVFDGNNPSARMLLKTGYVPGRRVVLAALPVFRRMRRWSRALVRPCRDADLPAASALLDATWREHELWEPLSVDSLRRLGAAPGYLDGTPLLLEDRGGLRACAAVLDRNQVTRVTVRSLSPRLRAMKTVLDLARRVVPAPRVPGPGEAVRQWMVTRVGATDPGSLRELLRVINNMAFERGIHQIFVAFEAGDPLLASFRGLPRVLLGGMLYVKPLEPGVALGAGRVFVDG